MIGGEIVVKSPPDGYTLAMASNSVYSIAPAERSVLLISISIMT